MFFMLTAPSVQRRYEKKRKPSGSRKQILPIKLLISTSLARDVYEAYDALHQYHLTTEAISTK